MTRHRGTCEHPDCGRVWRENCEDCLREVTDNHRAETGHAVHLQTTADDTPMWELRQMTRLAHRVLVTQRGRRW